MTHLTQKNIQWRDRLWEWLIRQLKNTKGIQILHLRAGSVTAAAVVGGASQQPPEQVERPQPPLFQGKMQLSPGGPSPHISSFYWTESDHTASPEPLTRKECKPYKANPEARVWPHRGGWHLCKTEALFGRRQMLQRHQTASSTGLPT